MRGGVLVVRGAGLSETAGQRFRPCGDIDPQGKNFLIAATSGVGERECPGCGMPAECLEYALVHDARFGIWGASPDVARRIS
jgi:WhiB family redox-sensing transcriptional regulator